MSSVLCISARTQVLLFIALFIAFFPQARPPLLLRFGIPTSSPGTFFLSPKATLAAEMLLQSSISARREFKYTYWIPYCYCMLLFLNCSSFFHHANLVKFTTAHYQNLISTIPIYRVLSALFWLGKVQIGLQPPAARIEWMPRRALYRSQTHFHALQRLHQNSKSPLTLTDNFALIDLYSTHTSFLIRHLCILRAGSSRGASRRDEYFPLISLQETAIIKYSVTAPSETFFTLHGQSPVCAVACFASLSVVFSIFWSRLHKTVAIWLKHFIWRRRFSCVTISVTLILVHVLH